MLSKQETYVMKRKQDPDMKYLRYGFFRDGYSKYSDKQIEGYLRQEFYNRRNQNTYVLDQDVLAAQYSVRR